MHKKRTAFAPSGHMLFGSYYAMQQTGGPKAFYFCQMQTSLDKRLCFFFLFRECILLTPRICHFCHTNTSFAFETVTKMLNHFFTYVLGEVFGVYIYVALILFDSV